MNPTEPIPAPAATAPVQPAPPSGVDPAQLQAELERYRSENTQLRAGLEQLRPYAEDIEWVVGDPKNAEFLRESRKAYEQARQARQQVPDELRPIAEKVDKLTNFVDEFTAAQARAAAEPRMRWLQEGKTFCEGLMAKHPNELSRSADPTLSWTGALQNICESRGLSWEEGWKILQPAFVKQISGPPPPSMRADSGLPGLPPPSRAPSQTGEGKKLGQIVLERMQSMS